jgi:hypothetical protein
MPLAILVLGLGFSLFASAGADQLRTERRASATNDAQVGIDRMIREIRQADWAFFRSSSQVDLASHVRGPGQTAAGPRLVRYACDAGECRRLEGPAVAFPPPADAPVSETGPVISGLVNADVFSPRRTDPATGRTVLDYQAPDSLWVRAVLRGPKGGRPIEVTDATSLRNATRFRR